MGLNLSPAAHCSSHIQRATKNQDAEVPTKKLFGERTTAELIYKNDIGASDVVVHLIGCVYCLKYFFKVPPTDSRRVKMHSKSPSMLKYFTYVNKSGLWLHWTQYRTSSLIVSINIHYRWKQWIDARSLNSHRWWAHYVLGSLQWWNSIVYIHVRSSHQASCWEIISSIMKYCMSLVFFNTELQTHS